MSKIEDGQVSTVSVLPQRIEFHLSRKSSLSFSGSSFKSQNLSVSESSGPLHSTSENGFDADFKFDTTVRRIGAGLENLGNTCFLNSVLQCLTYTEPLLAYLQSGKHRNSCRVVGFCSLCAIQKHIIRTSQATGKVLAPKEIVSNLRCISRNFRNGRQEDAHEYMVQLLESMHKCGLPSGVPNESSGAYEKSFVHKIFGGCLRSQVKCMECSYCSNKFDPFLDLSLEIVKADSLQKALMHFTAQEQLDGGERRYQCQKCKKKVRALKQLTIEKAPYVLTIHLKRFDSHVSGKKIDKKVQFGPTLNLKSFVSDSYDGDVNYRLYGVLVHAGWSTHSGHYFCFVRASNGMWYSLDDSRVVQVSEKTVMQQKAYMLFYVRDVKTSTSKNIVKVPNPTQNGSNSISATSQISEKRFTGGHANGSSVTQSPSQGFSKGCGEKDLKGIFQQNIVPKKHNDVDASNVVKNNISNGQLANLSLSKEGTVQKCNKKNLPQSSLAETAIPGSSKSSISEGKGSKINPLVSSAKPSECLTDVLGIAPGTSDKAGHAFVELVPKKKADTKAGSISARQKLKKGLLSRRVASAHLSMRMLYLASSKMQKRKKKVKRNNQLLDATMSIVDEPIEPSTSHVTNATEAHGSSASINGSKCGIRKRGADDAKSNIASSVTSTAENCDSELEKRIASGDTRPTGDDQSLKSPKTSSTLTHQPDRQLSGLIAKVNIANGISVGRWDDIEVEPSKTQTVNRCNTNTVSVGYVPDEWDEEYDRGKRKKIRMTNISFGGPNPFQEVATKAAAKAIAKSKHLNLANQTYQPLSL